MANHLFWERLTCVESTEISYSRVRVCGLCVVGHMIDRNCCLQTTESTHNQ
jgi:hypothetical protein